MNPGLHGDGLLFGQISHLPLDHRLDFTSTVGGQQPLIAWESCADAARTAL